MTVAGKVGPRYCERGKVERRESAQSMLSIGRRKVDGGREVVCPPQLFDRPDQCDLASTTSL
jgi:hypothetical protein